MTELVTARVSQDAYAKNYRHQHFYPLVILSMILLIWQISVVCIKFRVWKQSCHSC